MSASWGNLPPELLQRAQWCIAAESGAPLSLSDDGTLYPASVTTPATWLTFEAAATAAVARGLGIGFVLSAGSGLTCIDLDIVDEASQKRKGRTIDPSKWSTPQDFDKYWQLVNWLGSYTERSRSGKGLHVWLLGEIGKGRRRDNVEIYSQERFIICTGDVVNAVPIASKPEELAIIVSDMQRHEDGEPLLELPPTMADEQVWARAAHAENGAKFIKLCNGEWQGDYPSQSEADLALMSIFTFYSESNDQCRRMFRATKLGVREKAVKDDRYLNRTLTQIRTRQARERAQLAHGKLIADSLMQSMRLEAEDDVHALVRRMQGHQAAIDHSQRNIPAPPPAASAMAQLAPLPSTPRDDVSLSWPPGLVGQIAGFIYESSPRPVKEVAIVAALGFMAGLCGRTYNVSKTGLNMYLILVAQSGVGKEAMHSGISLLLDILRKGAPGAEKFINFNDFVSGPALKKEIGLNPAFLNVCGEWGRKLKRMADETQEGPMQQLRTVMTDLYQKSSKKDVVGGSSYSNKDSNVMPVLGAAYSMIGETTPSTLYESLTHSMMADGFLSRFTIVEYTGERPALNRSPREEPSEALRSAIVLLAQQCVTLEMHYTSTIVGIDATASALEKEFDLYCDARINETKMEARRQMWSRAHLKLLRFAALLAVGDDCLHPVIQEHHVEWARDLVMRNIALMTRRIEEGDVGSDDHTRISKVMALASKYVKEGVPAGYKVNSLMVQEGVIPRSYFQRATSSLPAFTKHRMGSSKALDDTLKVLIENGNLQAQSKPAVFERYGYSGQCYRVLSLE